VDMGTGVTGQSVIPWESKQGKGMVTAQLEGLTRVNAHHKRKPEM